jgi:hypothetical protein
MSRLERRIHKLEAEKRFINVQISCYNSQRAQLMAIFEAIRLAYAERTGQEAPADFTGEIFWEEQDELRADKIMEFYPETGA